MSFFYINFPNNKINDSQSDNIFKSSNSLKFHTSLNNYKPTPLLHLPKLANEYDVKNIYLKDESYRFGLKAFKGLGASYAIHKIVEDNPQIETFCTATDGNHGRAVAWSAKLFKKKAVVYMPEGSVDARIKAIENEGAIVEVLNLNYDETCKFASEQSKKNGWTLVQDTAWEGYEEIPAWIMAGYLTQFLEMEDSVHTLPSAKVDIVFLQAGVGSWAAAAAWYYLNRYGEKRPKLVIVESIEACGFLQSFQKGKRVSPNCSFKTIMAGLNCGIPSLNAWEILKETADVVIAIEDTYARKAMRKLYSENITAGESGASGFAAFTALIVDDRCRELNDFLKISDQSNILCFNTEGATDPISYKKIVNKIKIRRANPGDLDEMQQLFVETIKHACTKDYNPQQIAAWTSSVNDKERWYKKLSSQTFLVAEVDDKMVGYTSLEKGNYIDFLYVHKNHLGKGIASLLLKEVEHLSLQSGYIEIQSDVSKTARPFFERKGYKIMRENKILVNDVGLINYRMIKKLS